VTDKTPHSAVLVEWTRRMLITILLIIIIIINNIVVTGFMPSASFHAVSIWMMNPFVWQWVCGWGVTFAFHMRAFVALRLMPVACMPSFTNGRLAVSPDIRL